ncbi:hypothetical protein Pan216_05710 [Planctomycetes bacterium Pan216]|uniref:Uncharacterized protein n=1 Tax=Kolteria novifilia TaxID=2527975 RepID=A0A518AYE4_9BACT|nr:hypothetical protein Pan216_05710 [Planctomycetes bacterium Pan216]
MTQPSLQTVEDMERTLVEQTLSQRHAIVDVAPEMNSWFDDYLEDWGIGDASACLRDEGWMMSEAPYSPSRHDEAWAVN